MHADRKLLKWTSPCIHVHDFTHACFPCMQIKLTLYKSSVLNTCIVYIYTWNSLLLLYSIQPLTYKANVSNKCIKSEQKAVKVHISMHTRIHACFCKCTCSMHAHEMYKSSVLNSTNTLNSLLLLYSIQLHKANVSKYVIFLSMFLHRYVSNACRLNALCIVY